MADNISLPATTGTLAFDDVGGILYARTKISIGADGAAADCHSGNPLPVRNDLGARVAGVYDPAGAATATMARPADTTAYAALDLYANSTTGASVKPWGFVIPSFTAGSALSILRASIGLSNTTMALTSVFRLHLFSVDPTASWTATGDNTTLEAKLAFNTAGYIGGIDIQPDRNGNDIQTGSGTPVGGPILCNPAATTIYGLLELRTAYTPTSAQTARLWLEVGR